MQASRQARRAMKIGTMTSPFIVCTIGLTVVLIASSNAHLIWNLDQHARHDARVYELTH